MTFSGHFLSKLVIACLNLYLHLLFISFTEMLLSYTMYMFRKSFQCHYVSHEFCECTPYYTVQATPSPLNQNPLNCASNLAVRERLRICWYDRIELAFGLCRMHSTKKICLGHPKIEKIYFSRNWKAPQ